MQRRITSYFFALAATALAVVLRLGLEPVIGTALPFVTLFGAVTAAALVGGVGPAILATITGYIAVDYLFIEPRGTLALAGWPEVVGLTAYLFTSGLIIAVGEAARRARLGALEQSEVLRVTLASIGDAVISTDTQGRITYLNGVAESLTGWSAADARREPLARVFNIVNEDTRTPVESPVAKALREGAIVGLANHTILIRRDGGEVAIDDSAAPIKNERGDVSGCVLIFRDVSVRRRLEREAADRLSAANLLASIVESSDDAIVRKSLDGIIQSWNGGAERLFGYSAEEAIGRHISLVIPEERLSEEVTIVEALTDGRRVSHFETERVAKDGRRLLVSLTVSPVRNAAGEIIGASKIARDVTHRRRMEDDLRKMAVDLAAVDRQKDEFLATLAHELRNPLAPLRSSLELLRRTAGMPDASRAPLDTMDRQVSQLVRLVDDLLDLNRVLYNRLELRRSDVDLTAIIQQAIEISKPLIESAGHTLVVALPQSPIQLHADPIRLTQVFANLLNNSCKYTPPGGRISVAAERAGDSAIVRVTDSGVGIPLDQQEAIFGMFTQLQRSAEREREGLGIGLTLVRQLVDMHGGSVRVRSEGDGHGSEFVVTLPALAAAELAAEPRAEMPPPPAAPSRRVLIVDDNRDAAESLAMLVEHGGHTAFLAYDGTGALAAAERERPDIVLLDIGLPQMNGHDVCREIRKASWGRTMRVIALTGWGQDDDRRKSREAGFDAHLVKPVDYAALLAQLADASPAV